MTRKINAPKLICYIECAVTDMPKLAWQNRHATPNMLCLIWHRRRRLDLHGLRAALQEGRTQHAITDCAIPKCKTNML